MTKYFLDSSVWVEYLEESNIGKKAIKIVENAENQIYTNSIVIAEVVSRAKRKEKDPLVAFDAITTFSHLINIDEQVAYQAGIIHADFRRKIENFPLADAIIFASANSVDSKLVTIDAHFKGLKHVLFL